MTTLFTPWRNRYVTRGRSGDEPCFFCVAAEARDDPERLVVHWTDRHLVMLNRHPYTNGHLMVAPHAHVASPRDGDDATRAELWSVVLRCQEALDDVYGPDGFNLGANVGRAAGAGMPGHFHFHVVCRWEGDTNFMSAVSGVRMVPEGLHDTWTKLRGWFGHSSETP